MSLCKSRPTVVHTSAYRDAESRMISNKDTCRAALAGEADEDEDAIWVCVYVHFSGQAAISAGLKRLAFRRRVDRCRHSEGLLVHSLLKMSRSSSSSSSSSSSFVLKNYIASCMSGIRRRGFLSNAQMAVVASRSTAFHTRELVGRGLIRDPNVTGMPESVCIRRHFPACERLSMETDLLLTDCLVSHSFGCGATRFFLTSHACQDGASMTLTFLFPDNACAKEFVNECIHT